MHQKQGVWNQVDVFPVPHHETKYDTEKIKHETENT